MAVVRANKLPAWVAFLTTSFLLIGVFFAVRTAVNVFLLPQYPLSPSTSLIGRLSGATANTYTEDACQGDAACLNSFKEIRSQSMAADITNSAFFLFLGAGLLVSYKKDLLRLS